jgi:glycosyltransferase involved in cell wall biosynthesis
MKKVSFGIVNCNRLFYLRSCLESLLDTTSGYENKEFFVVDNASVESGTEEYLKNIESRGVTVIRKKERNPANEFAIGLNSIISEASGDYVCLLQGDMQFVLPDWLNDIISFYEKNLDIVGSVMLDAQRRITHDSHQIVRFSQDRHPTFCKNIFYADVSRDPISPAADAIFSRKVIEQIAPWSERNVNHEGSLDSENEMRYRVLRMMKEGSIPQYTTALSSVPQAIAIYTDPRGTQGRVRGNKRYGQYWPAKDASGWKYYEYINEHQFDLSKVNSIEEAANPIGFAKFLDEKGNWLKNPIRPESASTENWTEL